MRKSLGAVALAGLALYVAGCASSPMGSTSGKDLASTGPTVLEVNVQPDSTIELDREMKPTTRAEVVAEVKDFTSKVTDVKLSFTQAPIVVPMRHISGTTWKASLSPSELRKLAVGGKTMSYEANVIARDEKGLTASASNPVNISVKAPDLGKTTG